ncbi:hypothetical protein GWO43_25765 [candidate division KSB1 bacterium]|nr:hypothetical protein [candidate division KSB1 bacterium]NIR69220.1 hypothetical protein [candidate division KSB1 bacterium]NIS27394.1 hypothetical protein [candidate division KSB1 bacterium]NIT74219.1 hypothetical protein [candidate division KSB1 bacterium]NIU28111.1 hypothetical protein [candidate division KSB1 bacterium]
MPNPIVTITNCTPDNYSVTTNPGGTVIFKSGDNKQYYIDFGNNDSTVSKQTFPLEIPANGSTPLNVKSSTPAQTYPFRILDATRNQCCPQVDAGPGEEPPKVIVD